MAAEFLDFVKSGDADGLSSWLDANPGFADGKLDGGATPAQTACYYGKPDLGRAIAERMTYVDWGTACTLGNIHQAAVQLDLDAKKVDELSGDGLLPICLAAGFGHEALVDLLLGFHADLTAQSKSMGGVRALDSAIFGRNQSIIHKLLVAGADPNLSQGGGFYPIHGAAQNGNLEVFKDLVSHGARIDVKTDKGESVVDFAQKHPHIADYVSSLDLVLQ